MHSLQPDPLFTIVLHVVLAVLVHQSAANSMIRLDKNSGDADWDQFKRDYGKGYKDDDDEQVHKTAFMETRQRVHQHNAEYELGLHSFDMAINHLSDLTPEEYRVFSHGILRPEEEENAFSSSTSRFMPPMNDAHLPDHVDWREQGYVTPVKNQGSCGACWAFGATGALEGQHKRFTGDLVSLSEQNLIDCDTSDRGCNGGWVPTAFNYIKNNHGIDTESSYPYTGKQGKCKFNQTNVGATVTGWVILPENDTQALKTAVATIGPIASTIDASSKEFGSYKSGVVFFTGRCDSLDHGVLIVGYGTDPKYDDYWIVKNSWGTGWGEDGYIRVARNRTDHNSCWLAYKPTYPVV